MRFFPLAPRLLLLLLLCLPAVAWAQGDAAAAGAGPAPLVPALTVPAAGEAPDEPLPAEATTPVGGDAAGDAVPEAPAGEDGSVYNVHYLQAPVTLTYDLDRAVTIDRVIVEQKDVQPIEERAAQIEVLASTIASESDDDYISCGEFEVPPEEGTVACSFEPISAQFVKVVVTATWGSERARVGHVRIGRTGASLTGTVVDADTRAPLPACKLEILGGESAETGADGRFDIAHLPAGAQRLVAWHSGYAPLVRLLEVESTRSRSLEVALVRGSTDLFGLVRDDNGYPLADVNVTVKDTTLARKTDASGFYAFDNMKAGSTEIVFSKAGYRTVSASLLVSVGILARHDAEVAAGEDRDAPVPLKLSPFAYSPSDPKVIGTPSTSLYLVYDEPVDRTAINIGNYQLAAWAGDTATCSLRRLADGEVQITGLSFHAGDPSGATIRFNLACRESVTAMPFIEMTVTGVADRGGNAIPPPGRTIRNFSLDDYRLPLESAPEDAR